MLYLAAPNINKKEIEWIVKVIFEDILGIDIEITYEERNNFKIYLNDKELQLDSFFFNQFKNKQWLSLDSLPKLPLKSLSVEKLLINNLKCIDTSIPIIYGNPNIETSMNKISFSVDLLGSAFFMLSRYEENIIQDRDEHDRFSSKNSLAFKENFLYRPIINEYIEILFSLIKKLWPEIKRKNRVSKNFISADIDAPYAYSVKSFFALIKQIGGDILIRRNILRVFNNLLNFIFFRFQIYSFDPYFLNFKWMIAENLKNNNNMIFNFIFDHSNKKMDGVYNVDEPIIKKLIKEIYLSGLNLGIHFSYDSYNNKSQMKKELLAFKEMQIRENLQINELSSRQHILRYDPNKTISLLNHIGIKFDTTLTYHDRVGFRCGICYDYQMYDVINRKPLDIRIRPLMIMEVSLYKKNYMNLEANEGYELMKLLKKRCYKFNGDFTLLWHNHFFDKVEYKEIYKRIIKRK